MAILEILNENQKEAVLTTKGPVRLVAGAGSGKTRTITHRIAHLIEEGVKAENILAVTFTNKAANEMRNRIYSMAGEKAKGATISTYHSFCARLIRDNADRLDGFTGKYKIIDSDDQKGILRKIYKDHNFDSQRIEFASARDYIGECKISKWSIDDAYDNVEGDADEIKAEIYEAYTMYQKQNNLLDFNDLLAKAVELLEMNEDILDRYASKFEYIHVDEFQDTNFIQYELVKLLASKHNNICVVGDPDQTIYSWRGADITIINDFDKVFNKTKSITLEENYRSTKTILDAANSLIGHNKFRVEKNLVSNHDVGEGIDVYAGYSEDDEGAWAASKIHQLLDDGVSAKDILVLFRSSFVQRSMEQSFMTDGVPYRVVGGTRFYERQEIKDALAYMQLVISNDDLSFERVINKPKRGVGAVMLKKIVDFAAEKEISLYETLTKHGTEAKLSAKQLGAVSEFVAAVEKARKMAKENIFAAIKIIMTDSGYVEMLNADEKNRGRIENVNELMKSVEAVSAADDFNLSDYLNQIALDSNDDEVEEDKVLAMTIHKAKGLESKYVFVIGMSEGVFPGWQAINNTFELEEERRLAYVACTRAKEKLFISYSKARGASRFINELGSEYTVDATWEEKTWTDEEQIFHEVFGTGEIIETIGDLITVEFAQPHGQKTLMSNHKLLKRVK